MATENAVARIPKRRNQTNVREVPTRTKKEIKSAQRTSMGLGLGVWVKGQGITVRLVT